MKIDERDFLACEQAGMSAQQIADRFGVTRRTIVRWRKQTNLSHAVATIPHDEQQHEQARRLIEDGCSFNETAATLGVSWRTIRRWFPDATPWTHEQAGKHAATIRRLGRMAGRTAA